jgi:hypothetical protein
MNEILKEIAVKAQVEHCVSHVRLQEFTELLVQECVRYFNEDYQRDFDTLWREDLSKALKEHFGVKE